MITRVARFYVLLVFAAELFLLALSLVLHISIWMGESQLYYKVGLTVFVGALLLNFMVLCFARERNIWKNEFKSCPVWLRRITALFACYGVGVLITQILLCSSSEGPLNALTITAFPLAFEALSISVLYSVLWRGSLGTTELMKRAGISLIVAVAAFAFLLTKRLV